MTNRGFTLAEVLVALVLTGVLLVTGATAFAAAVDGVGAAERAVAADLTTANRRAWLERTLRSLEVGAAGSTPFEGQPASLGFSSRGRTGEGWWERRALTISQEGELLVARFGDAETITLGRGLGSLGFDYLIRPGLQSRWSHRWQSPVSAPIAIRVRLTWKDPGIPPDTILLFIGERG